MEIIEVKNKKQMRAFVQFPIRLYKDSPYFVPIFTGDEMKMLNKKKNPTLKDCEAHYYLAIEGNKVLGRIGAILHREYNRRTLSKCVRFTRFDCINDISVAKALFDTVEKFAAENGMEHIHGPYGFNETDRSGYLIEGFDRMANIGTNYNFPYYETLIKACGYETESNWLELEVLPGERVLNKLKRISDFTLSKGEYHIAQEKTFKKFAKRYGWKAFECFNDAYNDLPGYIPFSKELYSQIAAQFGLILKTRYMCAVIDKNDDVVGFAVCFPSMAKAVHKSKGSLFPLGAFRILKEIARPKTLELCLIGVRKEHQSKGVNGIMIHHILNNLMQDGVERTEAYPQFEENEKTLAQWRHFDASVIKKRRIVFKKIK